MSFLLVHLPFPGAASCQALWGACNVTHAAQVFDQHGERLLSTWLGRKILVKTFHHWRNSLSDEQIKNIWLRTLQAAPSASCVWQVWSKLAKKGVVLKQASSLDMWQVTTSRRRGLHFLQTIPHRLAIFLRLSLETVLFYFGIGTRDLFAARSLWDMQHRYDSLRRLTSLLVTSVLITLQAIFVAPQLIKLLGVSSLVLKVLLTSAVAFAALGVICLLFYGLRKLFQTVPSELWRCENLSYLAAQGRLEPIIGYHKLIQQLSAALYTQQSPLVMIRGEAGTGKTSLIKEFARRMHENQLFSNVGKPQVFLTNAANLKSTGYVSACEQLEVVRRQIEGFEKEVILAIDECHLLEGAAVEVLKGWKDAGVRLVLLTNSSDEALKKAWGENTFDSLFSHTRNSEITLKGPFEELAKQMIERSSKQHTHLRFNPEAQKQLVDAFKEQAQAPRLLANALQAMAHQAAQQQSHLSERVDLSNELVALEEGLSQARADGNWTEARRLAHAIAQKREEKKRYEESARKIDQNQLAYRRHLTKIQELTDLASRASARQAPLVEIAPLTVALEALIPLYRQQLDASYLAGFEKYPFLWNRDDVIPFCPSTSTSLPS